MTITKDRINNVQKNLLNQFLRVNEEMITKFWILLKNKVQKNSYELSSNEHYRLFLLFLLLMLDNDKKINCSIIRYIKKEDRKFICFAGKNLTLKKGEEANRKLISLFKAQEVQQELKRFLKEECNVYFYDEEYDGNLEAFLNYINKKGNNENANQEFYDLYKDLKLFGVDVNKVYA